MPTRYWVTLLDERPVDPKLESKKVLTRPFAMMLLAAFLGFGAEHLLRPTIPLIILARGGDVLTVGIASAAQSLPSVVLRPFVGRLADKGKVLETLRVGSLITAVAPVGVLIPGYVTVIGARLAHGVGWALYSVSTRTVMARLAPAASRSTASGYYAAMPALAALVGPAVGVGVYSIVGDVGPVVIASGLGALSLIVVNRMGAPSGPSRSTRAATSRTASPSRLLEPAAIPATLMLTMFQASHALFAVFPPVYALEIGESVETLVLYFPLFGAAALVSQVILGRVADLLGRGRATRLGCAVGIGGLCVGVVGDSMVTFTIAAAGYAIGFSILNPALSAMVMDRSPADRIGSAMATFTIGHGLAATVSSIVWGLLIEGHGFAPVFVLAGVLQALTAGISLVVDRRPTS